MVLLSVLSALTNSDQMPRVYVCMCACVQVLSTFTNISKSKCETTKSSLLAALVAEMKAGRCVHICIRQCYREKVYYAIMCRCCYYRRINAMAALGLSLGYKIVIRAVD